MAEHHDIPTSPVDEAIKEIPSRNENENENSNSLKVPFNTLTSGAKSLLNNVHFWTTKSPENSIKLKPTPRIRISTKVSDDGESEKEEAKNSNEDFNDIQVANSKEIRKAKSTESLRSSPSTQKNAIETTNRNSFVDFQSISNSDIPKETMDFVKSKVKNKFTRDFDKMFLSQILMKNGKDSTSSTNIDNNTKSEDNNIKIEANNKKIKPGAIWAFGFSKDGEYLAAGGQDGVIRIWGLRLRNNQTEEELDDAKKSRGLGFIENFPIFTSSPVRTFVGHQSDVLDLSWSKTGFLLSSSTDKTVRLWHVNRAECLCVYQHMDFVTSVAFHPKNDRYFISGSLDCRIRLWNIPEKKVSSWAELPDGNLVTAVGFSVDGKLAIAGSYHGLCVFYKTEGLKVHSQITVKSGAKTRTVVARKITGIEAIPDPNVEGGKVMITSNDSRIRIYNVNDLSLDQKLKGPENNSNQIKATFSDDLKYVVCGSENNQTFIFNLNNPIDKLDTHLAKKGFLFKKKEADCSYEAIEAHNSIVTAAVLAPKITKRLLAQMDDPLLNPQSSSLENPSVESYINEGHILISADYLGNLKVFRRNTLPAPYTPSIRSILFDDNLSIHKLGRISKELTRSLRRERKGSDASSTKTSRSNLTGSIVYNDTKPVFNNDQMICKDCNTNAKVVAYNANLITGTHNDNSNAVKNNNTLENPNQSTTSLPLQSIKLPNNAVVNLPNNSNSHHPLTTPSSPTSMCIHINSNNTILTICLGCKKVLSGLL
ncbi:WD40 repeat-like protein [Neoconidiobolus thromboides FSU 785]|nr:WD40 repeat-like protein [Neoconidiobolus thromboides FSU 785]